MALPPELEREIFELAVRMEIRTAPILMLVAKRVYTWISPQMYMNIALGRFTCDHEDALFMRTFTSKPGSFFANTVRSVCMTRRVSNDTAECILSECKGTQRLAWWADEADHAIYSNAHLLSVFSNLNLKELSCGKRLFDSVSALHELTHLELIFWDVEMVSIAAKSPRLTHFSLVAGCLDQSLGNFVGAVLEDCPGLIVFSVQFEAEDEGLHMQTWRTDPRMVVSFRNLSEPTRAWLEGSRWAFTERKIEERRRFGDPA